MAKVVFTDHSWKQLDVERGILDLLGCEISEYQCRSPEETAQACCDADYVINNFAPINSTVIDQMERARAVVRYGVGFDNVDIVAARDRQIAVCNVPDYCINEVADHTMALMLAALRQVIPNARHVREGHWGLAVPLGHMFSLHDLSVGIVGLGRIGTAVAARLQPFGCRLKACDPFIDAGRFPAAGCEAASWEELLQTCDVITLHCPAKEDTRHMICSAAVEQMKPGAIVVNTARGALIRTDDLVEALFKGRIGYAALDVLETEPMVRDHPLRCMENVLIHSHLAVFTENCVRRLRQRVAETVACGLRGEPLPNVVNGV